MTRLISRRKAEVLWAAITMVALVWPSRLSGPLDGAPLQGLAEALLIGFLVPILIWFNPAFLGRAIARVAIAAILLVKIATAVTLQQEGWCIAFEPPYPMVRESTGKPHAWDPRADWLADDPVCSAIMTHSYLDSGELMYAQKKGQRVIHRNYLSWIQNLVNDMNRNLVLGQS